MPYGFNDDRSKKDLSELIGDVADMQEAIAGLQEVVGDLNSIQILYGEIASADIAANTVRQVNVTFGKAFASTPVVLVALRSASTAVEYGDITAWTQARSTTGFTACIANKNTGVRAPSASYIAVGLKAEEEQS